jgi:thiamine biosynthesis lipoprotein
MGLPISVLARGPAAGSAAADASVQRAYDELTRVDAVFSSYRADSVVSAVQRGELALADCPAEVQSVAERCEWARELTGGLFDAHRPDGTWDPSGLVKGWAAERAFGLLDGSLGLDWCLNAGGDVVVLSLSGEPFNVGIADPRDSTRVCATVRCVEGAVATSGTAARGEHLYDPRSGRAAATRASSVSVHGPSLEIADVLATAAFVAGDDWATLVSSLPGYSALWVGADGSLSATPGWPREGDGA